MIRYARRDEDILQSSCDTIVIPVNCRGVMGKGIAYRTALMYPEDLKVFMDEKMTPGMIFINRMKERTIVHIAVQDDWRDRARYSYVQAGMHAFEKSYDPVEMHVTGIAPLGVYQGLLWKDVRMIVQKALKEVAQDHDFVIYPPLVDDEGSSRISVTAEGLLLLEDKFLLTKFNHMRLQTQCYMSNVFLGREHYAFVRSGQGPVCLRVLREAKRLHHDMAAFHISTAHQAYQLFDGILCTRDSDRMISYMKEPMAKAADFVNGIEDDLSAYGCTAILEELKNGFHGDETGMILKIRSRYPDSPFALCETGVYKNMFFHLFKAHLLETDMFGTLQRVKG